MLTVSAGSGFPLQQAFSDGVVHVTLEPGKET
jgi:hypothetical protein